ncbi:selenocysteine-specific translation elongation factor [Lutispora thermophila]|uniref:Selenocysteine-specific elongation factor n=1 Tax=Lutispora thermophila DSM 19022 TaxID=1122184 RepID=A0A1M6DAW6_9FIRM|nr:selenocysteine-specific translation elongation factor [Lutispora thermophila]SHI70377.1 selenocysteine-specific elongation factor [Lutispora thermophila DSM 19022]
MKHVIIGTAGHIDHGKTTLIGALTGRNTDRLKEERERGISIELGFTYFDLPSGRRAGIIDVPGHERFIKNMLAGIGGIDLVMLVVAADEGVMPQTKEHLNILSLLKIKKGIIVLTKKDMVDDEWLEIVIEQVKEDVSGTFLENAPIIPVSSTTREGLDRLVNEIDFLTEEVEPKDVHKPMRLPIDRVFSIQGFGTIVTGTLISGTIKEGDKIMIYPHKIESRVRSIQVHETTVGIAEAGQRVAINLAGIKVEEISRGDVIAAIDSMEPTYMFDAKLELLKDAERSISNRDRLRIYHGSAEVFGRVVLLDREELLPGENAFVQMRLEEQIACQKDDRFVIRFYSPMITIGGGTILDPNPPKRKRFREENIEELSVKEKGDIEDIVEQQIFRMSESYPDVAAIAKAAGNISIESCNIVLGNLEKKGAIKSFKTMEGAFYVHSRFLEDLVEKVKIVLEDFHKKNPLKTGMSKEELRTKVMSYTKPKVSDELYGFLISNKVVKVNEQNVSLWDFKVELSEEQEKIRKQIMDLYNSNKYNPPKYKDLSTILKLQEKILEPIYNTLIDSGELIRVDLETVFSKEAIKDAKELVVDYIKKNKSIQLGEFRDLLGTSRKYAMAILDYFDQIKITRRVEDKRILHSSK